MQQVADRQTKLAVNEGTSYGISIFSIKFLLGTSAGLSAASNASCATESCGFQGHHQLGQSGGNSDSQNRNSLKQLVNLVPGARSPLKISSIGSYISQRLLKIFLSREM